MNEQPDETPLLTSVDAIAIASRESFIVGPHFNITVLALPGDMVAMCLTRMTEGKPREFSMAIGRRRSPQAFTEVSRNVWRMLLAEHEQEKGRACHE